MTDWFTTRAGLLMRAWKELARGVAEADHPARQPTLATCSPTGWPEARTVVLRRADRATATLAVHTDLHSDKIASLTATPRAALHVWLPGPALQIRIQAEVTIAHGAAVRAIWDAVPDHARQSYGVTPPPGTPIIRALDYVKDPDPATFAVLTCRASHIDLVHLGHDHRRAGFDRNDDWAGQWLCP